MFSMNATLEVEKNNARAKAATQSVKLKVLDNVELEWVRKAKQGDQSAFTQLMARYQERVARYIFNMVGNQEDAQDLCQETFVRVYRALGSFDTHREFAPWVYRIAHNVAIDYLRQKKAKPAFLGSDPEYPMEERQDPKAVDPLQKVVSQDMNRVIQSAIQALPENYRSVIVFRYVDDLSYEEIAEVLGITKANVMMRMSRARHMLHERLKYLQ